MLFNKKKSISQTIFYVCLIAFMSSGIVFLLRKNYQLTHNSSVVNVVPSVQDDQPLNNVSDAGDNGQDDNIYNLKIFDDSRFKNLIEIKTREFEPEPKDANDKIF